ncbi:MAG: phosphoesterase [Acidobacteriota bacterium]|nr:phosphoesterase [Acidobacteriota bacterium]
MTAESTVGVQFLTFLEQIPARSAHIHILTDSDADGLPAATILLLALRQAGYVNTTAEVRLKFESAWSVSVIERLSKTAPDALIIADLGSRSDPILPGVPTLLLDHHRPLGTPPSATLITGYRVMGPGEDARELPTTGLMAYRCAEALLPDGHEHYLWLAAISLLSDLGDKAPFPEFPLAKKLYGSAALRDLISLLNAPRRSAAGDASSALELLTIASSPKEILTSVEPRIAELRERLLADKAEVAAALSVARKSPPRFSTTLRKELGADLVAIRMHTECQVHPLIAQQWRARFPKNVIFGINTGFRPGWVHFSGRAPNGVNLIRFLTEHRPEGADHSYGNGHDQAAGGALKTSVWNRFVGDLGFGAELQVQE